MVNAFFNPVTNPPPACFGDPNSFIDPLSELPASLGPAVAKKGMPGSTLNASGFPPKRFAGGGGTGERNFGIEGDGENVFGAKCWPGGLV